ncbi:hypothetical protein AL036_09530 [Salipiger aestuarii]|uniref:bifunctional DedA family/phosphatase PAP2 family protein n=1 Tax=Salipiger aestuarii TaxID=568098 RepID=UPI00123C05DC|nr:phosphatase PAP2 family protein [Salipiger aestuarii]KAA8607718.1 hypothetical protein AL036_09530 [Salipiger aestuarii]
MHGLTSQILPTLDAFGFWSYWIVGLASLLEDWWLTSVIVPGTLVVDAGGALVRLGHMDFIDLCWFVGIGAILGGEIGWHSGRWLGTRVTLPRSGAFLRAQELIRRRGGMALVLGRFLGPVAGFVPLAAALAGMERGRFLRWNIASGVVYALSHVAMGYVAGDVLARISPWLPSLLLPLGLLAALAALTWIVTHHLRRGWPVLSGWAAAVRGRLATWPPVLRHPRLAAFVAARLAPGKALLTTAAVVLVLYLAGVFVDGALDLAFVPGTALLDQRFANLMHMLWTPGGLSLAAWATQAGLVPVAALVALGAVLGLALWGRRASAIGLAVAVLGNAATVTVLKLAFGRARPPLAYILESSNSFPSGHAAISVALYGTLAAMLWREKVIGPTVAVTFGVAMAAGIGFTRLFLIEHYLSDVLNGWVIGSIWLVIGTAFAATRPKRGSARPMVAGLVTAACLAGALGFAIHDHPAAAPRPPVPPVTIADSAAALADGTLRLWNIGQSPDGAPLTAWAFEGTAPQGIPALAGLSNLTSAPGTDVLIARP